MCVCVCVCVYHKYTSIQCGKKFVCIRSDSHGLLTLE